MKVLPIGIQTFAKIRENDRFYYVDKTKLIKELADSSSYFFLSRPRRFGKSLFLDTLRDAFLGNREHFKGLDLENIWDWTKKHPVIRIDFGSGAMKDPNLLQKVMLEILDEHSVMYDVHLKRETISGRFRELIINLEKKFSSKVVILVDEYDKPILDNITDTETARAMRDTLRDFYSVIKAADAFLQFVFITGVSKFSKVNLFSGLNNLQDITLDERYATICGYTESELSVFEERMTDVNRNEMRRWYNGYNFMGESVYNPFDILLFLDSKKYKNYWCQTGNPGFLIDLIKKRKYDPVNIEFIRLSEEALNSFDVDSILLESILFQTGYLTVKEYFSNTEDSYYTLKYPNLEVKKSLSNTILEFMHSASISDLIGSKNDLREAVKAGEMDKVRICIHSFFASIPHDWYRNNPIAEYEGYYCAVFYCYMNALGFDVQTEVPTNLGQVDIAVFYHDKIYIFEFKTAATQGSVSALQQIKDKKYYEKYVSDSIKNIYLIGIEFSPVDRNISRFEWEVMDI